MSTWNSGQHITTLLISLEKSEDRYMVLNHTSWSQYTIQDSETPLCKGRHSKFQDQPPPRVTSVTRLFQSGAAEQLIMERTGHHNLDGVCAYKHTSNKQHKSVSDVLNSATNGTPTSASAIQAKAPKKQKLDQSLPPLSFTGCNNVAVNIGTSSSTKN